MIIESFERPSFLATCVVGIINPRFIAETSCRRNQYVKIDIDEEGYRTDRDRDSSGLTTAHTIYIVIVVVGVAAICICFQLGKKADQEVEEMREAIEQARMVDSEDRFEINDITEENPWEISQVGRNAVEASSSIDSSVNNESQANLIQSTLEALQSSDIPSEPDQQLQPKRRRPR